MKNLIRTALILATILLLSACSIFEPLPTLPALLTLEPEVQGQATAESNVLTQMPSPIPTNTIQTTSISTSETLPLSTSSISPTSAQGLAPTTSAPTSPPPAPTQAPATQPPVPKWKGVPVMPASYNLSEDASSYSYDVNNSIKEVRSFYDREMPEAGWAVFTIGEGETGNQLLIYEKDSQTVTIGLISQAGVTRVLIIFQ